MIVNEQKPIRFLNPHKAQFDAKILETAVLYLSAGKPVAQTKKVFMHGKYPAVSIHGSKFHIHRLIYSFGTGKEIDGLYIHHKNGDKLDASLSNLEAQTPSHHQSITNKGRKQSAEHIRKRTEAMWRTRYQNPELINK